MITVSTVQSGTIFLRVALLVVVTEARRDETDAADAATDGSQDDVTNGDNPEGVPRNKYTSSA